MSTDTAIDCAGDLPVILCIDDDTVVVHHLMRQIGSRFGSAYNVIAVACTQEAVSAAETMLRDGVRLALVISDLMMPDMGGDECLVLLHKLHPYAIKILLTGISVVNDQIINAINHADLYRYLSKPWEEEDLMLTVGQALEKYRLVARLQQRIDAQTSELFKKHEQLHLKHQELIEAQTRLVQSEKIAALGVLLAGVAHEIKNPAQFAHSGSLNLRRRLEQLHEFLLMMAGEDADPDLLVLLDEKFSPLFQNMEAIQDGTHRIQLLAGNLHTFSRLSDSDTRTKMHLVEGLNSTLLLVEANYRERVRFVTDCQYDPVLLASSARINQVLMNVIVNSCQAITTRQEAEGNRIPGCLEIRTFQAKEGVLGISFQDDGCGIPEENLERIFEPFFSTKPEGQGTGLGLSITSNIVEEHEGNIELQSAPGVGTTLVIHLPVHMQGESGEQSESLAGQS